MILPLSVDYDYDRIPWATLGLIAANVLFFGLQLSLPESSVSAFYLWPDRFSPWQYWTSGFLHGGFLHLGGNMLFLWVYGRYVEQRVGSWRYLLLYAAFAPAESLTYVLVNFGSSTPAIGASGVISALMGLVMFAAPRVHVKTLVWWGPIARVLPIQAGMILGLWLAQQFVMVFIGTDGIALSSHLGGFAAGAAAGLFMRRAKGGWHLSMHEQSREDLDAKRKSRFYSDLASYHRGEPADRPSSNHVPEWLKPTSRAKVEDPYEAEELRRWEGR